MNFTKYKVALSRLFLSFVLVSSFLIIAPASFASELRPSDTIKPSQSEPALGELPEGSNLTMEERDIQQNSNGNSKSKPSWWNWITNASRKPANYHFIDIIELLD